MKIIGKCLLFSSALSLALNAGAREYQGYVKPHHVTAGKVAAQCQRAAVGSDIDLNNVRALIYTGGDMWWDHSGTAKYEVPKGSGKTSLFAGALWLGGTDVNGQIRVAALRFRQVGDDYWPGPLNVTTAEVDAATCAKYDRHFRVNRTDVENFRAHPSYPNVPESDIPKSMIEWPAHGDVSLGQDYYLAPFFDADGDNFYNPMAGDYPYYDLDGKRVCSFNTCNLGLYGDETLWWVFNDKGNIHTETGASAIGMEIRSQGFAFSTNDEINNMTFYNYQLINRSTFELTETYFGQWVDADLGYAYDDYVGCDVGRGLGFCYNGTDVDGTGQSYAYGVDPPAVGVDFFEGPYMDPDGIDDPKTKNNDPSINGLNFGDGIVDNERWGMRRFLYHNNNTTVTGDPTTGVQYYNYLRGIWRDNTRMLWGGNGHVSSGACGPETDFMFPADTDPTLWGTAGNPVNCTPYWDEIAVSNVPDDRRFAQSAGPFTLKPGACNNITVGVCWARAASGGRIESVNQLKEADDKAQALFEYCFKILNGPDAPDLTIRELNNEIILSISNPSSSNNYNEQYEEVDPLIVDSLALLTGNNKYKFEGYQIYQLSDESVTLAEKNDPDKVRLVAQCDVKNGVSQLVNFYKDVSLGANLAVEEVKGGDKGIQHTFRITTDLFATGDNKLVNHKPYYYTVVCYGYNNFKTYNAFDPMALDGQKLPYKSGRRRIKTYSAIPHNPSPNNNGQILNSVYGNGVQITRIEGTGNGGNVLDLTQSSIDEIVANGKAPYPVYEVGKGPINVKIYDPVKVPKANFTLKFVVDSTSTTWTPWTYVSPAWAPRWILTNETTGESVSSDTTINVLNEQIIPQWGLSVAIQTCKNPGFDQNASELKNGFIESSISFSDISKAWFFGVPDQDGTTPMNWIRSGLVLSNTSAACTIKMYDDWAGGLDSNAIYEKVVFGIFAPYKLGANQFCLNNPVGTTVYSQGPCWVNSAAQSLNKIDSLSSIDIVMTPDKSKWSRCVVLETGEDSLLLVGSPRPMKLDLRQSPSVDKDGNPDGTGKGMGWFPGYAINVETGERLNIMFGEDSWLKNENGTDMIFNPTSTIMNNGGQFVMGGKHYIYVMRNTTGNGNDSTMASGYDGCAKIAAKLAGPRPTKPSDIDKRAVFRDMMWVGLPLKAPDQDLLACDVKIRIRVTKPYKYYKTSKDSTTQNNNWPMYRFSTSGLEAKTNDAATAKSYLDNVNVVPNPYYAYAAYEQNQLDTRIKIVNLPNKCTISIYSINGTLIRRFKRDVGTDVSTGQSLDDKGEDFNLETAQEWDLKNTKGIPISSGMYLIHVKADGVGEKVIKWFGVLRPTDLNSY